MKIENIVFTEDEKKNNFIKRCLFNKASGFGLTEKLVERAHDTQELTDLILNNKELKLSQSYAEVSKITKGHWYRVRKMLGNDVFKTTSEVGSLKIGNDEFCLYIPNGYGDGITRLAIIDACQFNSNMMNYFTRVSGKFNIYSYDCGDGILKTIEGDFDCYYYDGMIALVKM